MSGAAMCMAGCVNTAAASSVVLVGGSPYSWGIGTRIATVRLSSDGYCYHGDNASYAPQYLWLQSGTNTDFEVYATLTSGSISGTTGAWLGLGTTRDWSVVDVSSDGDSVDAVIDLTIRDVATSTVRAYATFNLTANQF